MFSAVSSAFVLVVFDTHNRLEVPMVPCWIVQLGACRATFGGLPTVAVAGPSMLTMLASCCRGAGVVPCWIVQLGACHAIFGGLPTVIVGLPRMLTMLAA